MKKSESDYDKSCCVLTRPAGRILPILILFASMGLLSKSAPAFGEVVRMAIERRVAWDGGQSFGRSGPYERITGKLHIEVDPDDPANKRVTDLKLADRNEDGNVEFWTDFQLLAPVDPSRGNRRLLYLVNNRGSKVSLPFIDADGGNDWLFRQGYAILWCGWNGDALPGEDKLNMGLPIAHENGKTITGEIYAEICTMRKTYSQPFYWGGSVVYPVVSLENSHASLTMRPRRSAEPTELPRDQWSFARMEGGKAVPDLTHLFINEGFRPGWLYDLVYVGRDPRVTGLGFVGIRDAISFFRYDRADDNDRPNPLEGSVEYVYGYGISQSGRVICHFIYDDFNGDEQGRLVFDGVMPHVGGAGKGLFNYRFAQTTRHGSHHEDNLAPSDFFPFTTVEQFDPVTGQRGDALARARLSGRLPKIFFTMTSTEYWARGVSLLHTDVEGKRDIRFDPAVRFYFYTGRTHNDQQSGPLMRALFVALDEWVSQGKAPPPSRYPKISDGTLVDLAAYRQKFPAIPGAQVPESYYRPLRLDLGPRWQSQGIADVVPPRMGLPYNNLLPAIDADGNELAGIRLPDIAVPIGTFVGWRLRGPDSPAAGTLERWSGTRWPFARTAQERRQNGDPRPDIQERYPTRRAYLAQVADVVLQLQNQRFLLKEDAINLLRDAANRPYWNDTD